MRNEAPVIVLAEWAAQANAETRIFMGVSVAPEIPERQEARAYLASFMSDEEAAACVSADLERVDQLKFEPISDDTWSAPSWHEAAVEYHQARGNRLSIVPAEVNKPARIAVSTLMAAEHLVRAKDPKQLRQWLDRHSADERAAIQKHLGGKHAAKPRADR
jgi:hypothetical protein